ncbi:unnamed protein product [Phytomonas sp. EM1]|nr:unnamed protein product [Phytomonas sp. EM1]|eukprot:CCW60073.1 unnamed protein product [Phytomonas sp. isolate EM1]
MHGGSDSDVVQHVLRNKADYYRIFNLQRTANNEQIKSAYKKMALRCHPDKNKHSHAVEAFKIVGEAHSTLIDPTKRRIYDQVGPAGVQQHERTAGRRQYAAHPGRDAFARNGVPAGARDFFEEFFFGNGGFQQYQRNYYTNVPQGGFPAGGRGVNLEADSSQSILMIIPIAIFLLLALLLQSNFMDFSSPDVNSYRNGHQGNTPSFSLTPSQVDDHIVRRVTSLHGIRVPYYTTQRWDEVTKRRKDILREMERDVLRRQERYLGNLCEAEKIKYRSLGRKDIPDVCTEYQELRRALGG